MFYWYQICQIPLLYFEIGDLTSQLYALSAVLQMNKDIQKVWHNDATKHPENQWITSRSVVDG
jgi:hypothetical protein